MSYYPSWDNGNSNKGPRKKGRANGDPPATKMTRSTERTGMITALKAGIEENALNLLAHSTKTEKEVIGAKYALSSEKRARKLLERSSPMRREERPRHPHATDKQRSELLAKGVVSPGLSERAHSPPPALAQ
ncbi:hypothetical protein V6N12_075935 [Hibiscus sabdariffa]|uniref:Uncharacterized protein n=1 Tax=Hibiscus sabdariffa TaxID=183260 RepID=A0ABR2AXR4_9ROSI